MIKNVTPCPVSTGSGMSMFTVSTADRTLYFQFVVVLFDKRSLCLTTPKIEHSDCFTSYQTVGFRHCVNCKAVSARSDQSNEQTIVFPLFHCPGGSITIPSAEVRLSAYLSRVVHPAQLAVCGSLWQLLSCSAFRSGSQGSEGGAVILPGTTVRAVLRASVRLGCLRWGQSADHGRHGSAWAARDSAPVRSQRRVSPRAPGELSLDSGQSHCLDRHRLTVTERDVSRQCLYDWTGRPVYMYSSAGARFRRICAWYCDVSGGVGQLWSCLWSLARPPAQSSLDCECGHI